MNRKFQVGGRKDEKNSVIFVFEGNFFVGELSIFFSAAAMPMRKNCSLLVIFGTFENKRLQVLMMIFRSEYFSGWSEMKKVFQGNLENLQKFCKFPQV